MRQQNQLEERLKPLWQWRELIGLQFDRPKDGWTDAGEEVAERLRPTEALWKAEKQSILTTCPNE